jgi:hypothetical protein
MPTPTPTDTPPPTITPLYGGGHAPAGIMINPPGYLGGLEGNLYVPENYGSAEEPVFHDQFSFEAYLYDPTISIKDGAGVDYVQFNIYSEVGELVMSEQEQDARFCSQNGGSDLGSTCPTLHIEPGARWPNDGPLIEAGRYFLEVYAVPENSSREPGGWNAYFWIDADLGGGGESDLYAEIAQLGNAIDDFTIAGAIVFQVVAYDRAVGTNDGDGIDYIDFEIFDDDGDRVHEEREENVHYCAFQGGEPDCNVWVFSEHDNKWRDGDDFEAGVYTLRARVRGDSGQEIELRREVNILP